jgi:LPXTG-motif cell wall-anchored protein
MIRRSVLVAGTLLLVVIGLGTPARAGMSYPPAPGISVDKPEVDPGDQVTVTGDGCDAGVDVTITLGDDEVATATTADDGTFSATFEVPASTTPGTYSVNAIDCTAEVLSTTLTVRAAGTTPTPTPTASGGSTLPRTGSDTTESIVRVGVILLACGGLMVLFARRRAAAAGR